MKHCCKVHVVVDLGGGNSRPPTVVQVCIKREPVLFLSRGAKTSDEEDREARKPGWWALVERSGPPFSCYSLGRASRKQPFTGTLAKKPRGSHQAPAPALASRSRDFVPLDAIIESDPAEATVRFTAFVIGATKRSIGSVAAVPRSSRPVSSMRPE